MTNPITLVEAVNQALHYEMAADKDVIVLGEDVAQNGGVFRATVDLYQKFGADRVLDTPLAESMIAGLSIGMSVQGLKPVAEFQFDGFIYPAFNQIISHAARMRNRTRGRLHCPIVFRAPFGGGIHAPEHHSESPEAFAHIPGLRVVIPSSPAKAYGLLLAAIRDPDPVIFFEPKRIYRKIKQVVPDHGKALPLDKAFILKPGTDITFVTWGAITYEVLEAAQLLQAENISAEVIDLATIKPIDTETILDSVRKTGKVVIVHEAPGTCGVGAEIAARISENLFYDLMAPIVRVTGFDITMPYSQLENHAMPSVEKIFQAAKSIL